jgi:hypothetical protein
METLGMNDHRDYHGPERRDNSEILEALAEIKVEMATRLSRIETRQEDGVHRCNAHAEDISGHNVRITSLEDTRSYTSGVIKAVSVGAPAVGTIAYTVHKMIEYFKHLK